MKGLLRKRRGSDVRYARRTEWARQVMIGNQPEPQTREEKRRARGRRAKNRKREPSNGGRTRMDRRYIVSAVVLILTVFSLTTGREWLLIAPIAILWVVIIVEIFCFFYRLMR